MVHLISGMLFTLGMERSAPLGIRVRRHLSLEGRPQHAGRTRCCSIITAFRYTCGWAWERKHRTGALPGTERHSGSKGTELRYSPQTGKDTEPSYYSGGFPLRCARSMRGSGTPSTIPPGHEPLSDDVVYDGHDWDDVRPHLWNFFRAVKTRKPVVEDAVFGNHAAIACHMANESYFRKKPVFWDAESHDIKKATRRRAVIGQLPDIARWSEQFKAFRYYEVWTLMGCWA